MSQPIIDEFILGYRRQFPGQMSVDVAGIARKVHNMFAQTDINGIYPGGPNQPFGGFGLVDPNQGHRLPVDEQHLERDGLPRAADYGGQEPVQCSRRWRRSTASGSMTAARGIRPTRRVSSSPTRSPTTGCSGGRGTNDHNSYPGNTLTAPMWNPYSYRFNGTWNAPAGIVVGGSYSVVAGGWSGRIVDQLPANSPQLAPSGPRRWSLRRARASRTRCRRGSASSTRPAGRGRSCWPSIHST